MLKNYLIVAWRNILRNKGYTIINTLGLAIGIASSILILLFVMDELSFDRHNENFKNIYRINVRGKIQGSEMEAALSNAPMGPTLVADFPEVTAYTRLFTFDANPIVRYGENVFIENKFYYADSSFFDVFTAPAIQGDPNNMLNRPNTVVLTEETARKYFGDEDPIGKILKVGEEEEPYEVTGIVKGFPANSHFTFDMLASMESIWIAQHPYWLGNNNYTYIVLRDDADPDALEAKFPELIKMHMGPQLEQMLGLTMDEFLNSGNEYGYFLTPMKDFHLKSDLQFEIEPGGSMTSVYIFSIIAVFLILIAAINFMNLATASSARRAVEVGMKKVAGASRKKLIWQFLSESMVITFMSLVLAVILVELFLPAFNNLSGKSMVFNIVGNHSMLPALILIGLFVGFVSGSYPAFFLSSYKPVNVLKGNLVAGKGGRYLRSILVTLQFTITISLFISTFVVNRQMHYIQKKDLGFNQKNLVVIERAYALGSQQEAFRQELLKNPDIVQVSASQEVPGGLIGDNAYLPVGASTDETHAINNMRVDPYFMETYGLELVEGRFFSVDQPTDTFALLLNQAAVRALGFENPLEEQLITNLGEESEPLKVIGVVKDFNFQSLHQEIRPLILRYLPWSAYMYSIRISGQNTRSTVDYITSKWDEFVEDQPIVMSFLEDDLNKLYSNEQKTATIFTIFSILAIFIASLGLLGLASFSAAQRTKEVGVRKAMGASVGSVLVTLSRETVWLVLFATLISWPLGYFFMKDWLQNFASRIELAPIYFIISTLLAFIIAIITVTLRVYQAASANPVKSLRYE